jgi:hypothetical protein
MREILFRGIADASKEWVEGFLYLPNLEKESGFAWILGEHERRTLVLLETVGQFTGLLDKNGVKVFEGDVVKILYTDWLSKSADDPRTLEEYLDDKASLGTVVFEGLEYQVLIEGCLSSLTCGKHGFVKVVGNVWEDGEREESKV